MTDPVPSSPDTPLGPADFEAQDAQLDALREQGAEVPEWEFCEGFLAALVCCRREIPPQEYWPVLLGEGFQPMAHMEFVWRWLRRWKEVAAALDAEVESLDDARAYDPPLMDTRAAWLLLPEEQRGDYPFEQLPSVGEVWANGFLSAVEAWPDDWAPPRDKEAAGVLRDALETIDLLTQPERGGPTAPVLSEDSPCSASEERLDNLADALWAVYDLRSLWKSLGPRRPAVRKEPTPGRNDPCPCGSGLKFKKCHGA